MRYVQVQILGSLLVLVILILRTITKRFFPKKLIVILWDFTMLSFLLPFFYRAKFAEGSHYLVTINSKITSINESITKPLQRVEVPLEFLITLGMIVLFIYFMVLYLISICKFKKSDVITDSYINRWLSNKGRSKGSLKNVITRAITVRESRFIDSPMTFGILHPVILLPLGMKDSSEYQKSLVLEHEYHHIRHFDALRKLMLLFIVSLHWFNPMIWLMCIIYNKDIEYACDEAVLKSIGLQHRKEYSLLLVNCAKWFTKPDLLSSYLSKNSLEKRVSFIMGQKNRTLKKKLISYLLLGCVLIFILITQAITAYTSPVISISDEDFLATEIIQKNPNSDTKIILKLPYNP